MTTYLNNLNICNSDFCSHPSCWNNCRVVFRNCSEIGEVRTQKPRQIDIPYQTVSMIDASIFPDVSKGKGIQDMSERYRKRNCAMVEYLLSRKKLETPLPPHVTPCFTGFSFKEVSNNAQSDAKCSQVEVHEIFDVEELESDWKKTFKSKDIYIWVPGNKSANSSSDKIREKRFVKTPILQLAPVIEKPDDQDESNSGRKIHTSMSVTSELPAKSATQLPKRTMAKTFLKKPISVEYFNKLHSTIKKKDDGKCKFLTDNLNPKKMQMHHPNDKLKRNDDFYMNEQPYHLDTDYSANLQFTHGKYPMKSQYLFKDNRNYDPIYMNIPKPLSVKPISIIDGLETENSLDFRLGPHRPANSVFSSSSRSRSSYESVRDDKQSKCDSMFTNVLSDRSTLNDDDLYPGNALLQMLQESYRLVQERSELILNDRIIPQYLIKDHENLILHNDIVRNAAAVVPRLVKSAPEYEIHEMETPNPPPPSPDMAAHIRSRSVQDVNPIL